MRDEESTEVGGWCAYIRKFSEGPVPGKNVKDMLAAHGIDLPIPEQPQSANGAVEMKKMEIARIFRQGLQWQSDDTATLPPLFLDILKTVCTNAEQHLQRRADR
jgi:hypothetical protein